jgi:hypothetical protein
MGDVISFPAPNERDWRLIEETIRKSFKDPRLNQAVVEEALPAIKEHWRSIFVAVSLQAQSIEVPAPLTNEQLEAIHKVGEATSAVLIERLKHERGNSLSRLISVEIMLAQLRIERRGA